MHVGHAVTALCIYRYNSCGAPQEYTNEEIDRELYEGDLESSPIHQKQLRETCM